MGKLVNSILFLATVVMVCLKLAGVIAVSWFVALLPFLISIALGVITLILVLIAAVIAYVASK